MNSLRRLVLCPPRRLCLNKPGVKSTCPSKIKNEYSLTNPSNRMHSTETPDEPKSFVQSFEQQEAIRKELHVISLSKRSSRPKNKEKASFASLLRNSSFVGLGDFRGKIVTGKVIEIVGPHLFVDYGGKFLCVCKRPRNVTKTECRDATVLLKLLDWELSAKFLGGTRDITLLESEGIVLQVYPSSQKYFS